MWSIQPIYMMVQDLLGFDHEAEIRSQKNHCTSLDCAPISCVFFRGRVFACWLRISLMVDVSGDRRRYAQTDLTAQDILISDLDSTIRSVVYRVPFFSSLPACTRPESMRVGHSSTHPVPRRVRHGGGLSICSDMYVPSTDPASRQQRQTKLIVTDWRVAQLGRPLIAPASYCFCHCCRCHLAAGASAPAHAHSDTDQAQPAWLHRQVARLLFSG